MPTGERITDKIEVALLKTASNSISAV